jgi:tRNA G18 (ribose-2'-O)-methylase SpoU
VIFVYQREKARRLALRLGLKIVPVSRAKLDQLSQQRPHQGVVLECSPLKLDDLIGLSEVKCDGYTAKLSKTRGLSRTTKHDAPLWLALDRLMDPQVVQHMHSM